jgi:polysaccharide chain length determinant protein (PEP-CTERM system associated)
MLPGKKYTPEDVMAILRRRFWWLLVPLAVAIAIGAVVARVLPDLYRSETLILVVPQRVPESYVRSTVTTRIEDRLQSISQQILSRTRLERIISDFNLYADELRRGPMEDVVERMRSEFIDIRVQRGDAFTVSFIGRDPRTVMQVTDRLASFFIEESLRDRQVLAEGTNQFLESQLEDARRRLLEQEQRLVEFRRRHDGELPSQVETNLRAVGSIQVQMQSVLQQIDRDQERRIVLERELAELAELQAQVPQPAAVPPTPATAPGAEIVPPPGSTSEQVRVARQNLEAARLRLKPEHPDILRLQRIVRDLQAKLEAEQLEVPLSAAAPRPSPTEEVRVRREKELRDELDRIDRDIVQMREEEDRLRTAMANYQGRAQAATGRESEMTALMRDYGPLQSLYSGLLSKREDARIAANLEQRQIGEQFRVLDSARLPERPFSPDRQQISLFGALIGLVLGAAVVGLLEYRDRTFKNDDEVTAVLALPVLAVVPRMRSDRERRRDLLRRAFVSLGLGTVVLASVAIFVYSVYR